VWYWDCLLLRRKCKLQNGSKLYRPCWAALQVVRNMKKFNMQTCLNVSIGISSKFIYTFVQSTMLIWENQLLRSSRTTVVSIHWIHLRMSGICTKSFCKQKWIIECCSKGCFQRQCGRMSQQSWYSELNSIQNVYFGLFIFWKLTEQCHFVTCGMTVVFRTYWNY